MYKLKLILAAVVCIVSSAATAEETWGDVRLESAMSTEAESPPTPNYGFRS
jgi:hypothetical protein